ncbi:MAG: UDPGP type 1 family protein [Lentisphaerae bacterium]|nr:UDPGP type 1 family protein [Lentisphaerota bacterium]
MTFEHATEVLHHHGQGHVLRFWDRLDGAAREALLAQIATLDFESIARMREMLAAGGGAGAAGAPQPADVVTLDTAARAAAVARGEAELRAGRVGVLLVAGGQGSRLGYDGPKGAYVIGPASGATLFHYHARKVLALSRRHGVRVPFYILTSDTNDAATRAHFEEQGFFGLAREDVFFFMQGMWPALDASGRIILDAPGHIFMSPDGHGGTLSALAASGGLADMERRGLTTVFYFQVDNPLVEVADPAFIGLHLLEHADISIKVCAKREPQEGLGVVVMRDGRCEMVEYSELTDEQKHRRTPDGGLVFNYGSVAIHVFSLPFLRQEALRPLPLHLAHKKIPFCADDGTVVKPTANTGYKFEKFIFDVLPDAKRVVNLAFDRADEFSPVKNASGPDSPETCRRDLQAKWARWFAAAGVTLAPAAAGGSALPLEIDPAYALDAEELGRKAEMLKC